MKTWHFYDPQTGIFSSRTYSGLEPGLKANTPKGMAPFEGRVDRKKQRLNLETKALVDHETAPDERYAKRRERARILAELKSLDDRQARPLAELVVKLAELLLDDSLTDSDLKMLKELRQEKAVRRLQLRERDG